MMNTPLEQILEQRRRQKALAARNAQKARQPVQDERKEAVAARRDPSSKQAAAKTTVRQAQPPKALPKPTYRPLTGLIYEDDERPQARIEMAVRNWRDRDKAYDEGPVTRPPLRKPPAFEDGVKQWQENKKPPLYIQPMVGPTQDLKQQAGMRAGFTPEAQDAFRRTHVVLKPPHFEPGRGGGYFGDSGIIDIMANPGGYQRAQRTMAHEFGHKWFEQRLTPDEQAGYIGDHQQWKDPSQVGSWVAQEAEDQFDIDQARSNLYDDDAAARPTETYARVLERVPQLPATGPVMPGYMNKYFRGYSTVYPTRARCRILTRCNGWGRTPAACTAHHQ